MFRSQNSGAGRLLQELAAIAGQSQGLVDRLKRHAAQCGFPNLKAGALAAAEREASHAKALKAILSARNVWARMPEAPIHEGANNWARFGKDLAELAAMGAALRNAIAEWEPADPAVAEKLLALADEDAEIEGELRLIALKCDPQAVD